MSSKYSYHFYSFRTQSQMKLNANQNHSQLTEVHIGRAAITSPVSSILHFFQLIIPHSNPCIDLFSNFVKWHSKGQSLSVDPVVYCGISQFCPIPIIHSASVVPLSEWSDSAKSFKLILEKQRAPRPDPNKIRATSVFHRPTRGTIFCLVKYKMKVKLCILIFMWTHEENRLANSGDILS